MTSQARIDANRRNARKSTGPRTPEGKGRSSLNAMDHGLRSGQVVLPTEDRGAFDAHLAAFMDDWRPGTATRPHLVKRAAVAAWRLDRCVRVETGRLSERAGVALDRWDGSRAAANRRAVDGLESDPIAAVAELESSRGGVARLVGLWRGLSDAAREPGGWDDAVGHHRRFFLLQGYHTNDPDAAEAVDNMWRLLLVARPDLVEEGEPGPFDERHAEGARYNIRVKAARETERLMGVWEALPDESAARARYAELEAFAPRPEDAALLRYEAQFDREFRASINQLVRLTQTGADLSEIEPEAGVVPNEAIVEAVEAPAAPDGPNPEPSPAPSEPAAPDEPNGVATTLPVARADRDRDGRVWATVTAPEGSGGPDSPVWNR